MHCFDPQMIVNPKYTSKTEKGRRNLDIYRGLVGDPFAYPDDYQIIIPCGKCLGCLRDKARSWRVRLLHEHMFGNHISCHCLTLTIAPEYYDQFKTRKDSATRFREFIDRLRYYCVGRRCPKRFFISELGEEKSRLHFHGFIWDCPELNDQIIARAWRYGFVCVRPLRSARQLSYATKYITKAEKAHVPMLFVSPKLGEGYTRDKRWTDWHHAGNDDTNINLCVRFDTFVYAMPRYYRDKIFTSAEISDFKVCLSKDDRSQEYILGRRSYEDPLQYAKDRERLFQTTLRSGKSISKKPYVESLLSTLNPFTDSDLCFEFNNDLTPF